GDFSQARAAVMGLETAGSRRRGHAGPVGGAGRRLLCQGVWRDVPWPAALPRRRAGDRGRSDLTCGHAGLGIVLSTGRRTARSVHRSVGTRGAWAKRGADATAEYAALAVDRAGGRKPQLLQR